MMALRRCVVAGGAGAVGYMFASLLAAEGARVCVVDPARPPAALGEAGQACYLPGDITCPGSEVRHSVSTADLVLLALPEQAALRAIRLLAPLMAGDAVLAHTLSVQSPAAEAIRQAYPGRPAVGLNPLFAPGLGLTGRAVAAVVVQDGPGVRELLAAISRHGATVTLTDAASHDRETAVSQVLTHACVLAFGLALAELGADSGLPAPPPHAVMLGLLARIAAGTPEVYAGIQADHPMAGQARQALARAAAEIAATAGDREAFTALLGRIRDAMGEALDPHAESCAAIFRDLTTQQEARYET